MGEERRGLLSRYILFTNPSFSSPTQMQLTFCHSSLGLCILALLPFQDSLLCRFAVFGTGKQGTIGRLDNYIKL